MACLLADAGKCAQSGPSKTASFGLSLMGQSGGEPRPRRATDLRGDQGPDRERDYRPGARLPSTRAFAAEWGVSRTTVTAAYEQLLAEGYLETRQGARAQSCARPKPGCAGAEAALTIDARHPPVGLRPAGRRSPLASAALSWAGSPSTSGMAISRPRISRHSLGSGPSSAAILRRPTRLRYGDPRGSPELRAALQGYLWRARGLQLRFGPDHRGERVAAGARPLRPTASRSRGSRRHREPLLRAGAPDRHRRRRRADPARRGP